MSEILTELNRDLEVTEALIGLGAATTGEVESMLRNALEYVSAVQPASSDAADEQAIYRAQLNSELDLAGRLDRSAPAPADQWPRQRRAIERAYYWSEANGAVWEHRSGESSARKKALDDLTAGAGDAAKGLGQGLMDVLSMVVVLIVLLVVAQLATKTRAA